MSRLHFVAELQPWGRRINLHAYRPTDQGITFIGQPIVMKETPHAQVCAPVPIIELRTEEAQELMDSLWQCGLRPSEGTGSAGALAATERHLKDLQRIVFKER